MKKAKVNYNLILAKLKTLQSCYDNDMGPSEIETYDYRISIDRKSISTWIANVQAIIDTGIWKGSELKEIMIKANGLWTKYLKDLKDRNK